MTQGRDENRWQGESVDSVLRKLLAQGRLDPQAERLAEQGIDRLRSFFGAATGPAQAPEEAEVADVEVADVEVAEASEVPGGRSMLMHTIPLADGTRVEVLVPERLTRAEADRVAGVLGALAVEE
ncbi:hypothetical protein [Kineococcus rhizosphaerae]|uniref:Uncharacterized protein n=1 Tax=Kineococcus rhizosphaerae TaxID=559628 RepID=A0A2T0R7D8_9ACTN|nr:hypothetical protein [Kineococcus rhizosphaerae]PRY17070.1 hypothetical protein CLV37_10225 [Kineococcus rhizosphaerae]